MNSDKQQKAENTSLQSSFSPISVTVQLNDTSEIQLNDSDQNSPNLNKNNDLVQEQHTGSTDINENQQDINSNTLHFPYYYMNLVRERCTLANLYQRSQHNNEQPSSTLAYLNTINNNLMNTFSHPAYSNWIYSNSYYADTSSLYFRNLKNTQNLNSLPSTNAERTRHELFYNYTPDITGHDNVIDLSINNLNQKIPIPSKPVNNWNLPVQQTSLSSINYCRENLKDASNNDFYYNESTAKKENYGLDFSHMVSENSDSHSMIEVHRSSNSSYHEPSTSDQSQHIDNQISIRLHDARHSDIIKAAKSLYSKRTRTLYHWMHPKIPKAKLKASMTSSWDNLPDWEKKLYISQVLGKFGVESMSPMLNPQLSGPSTSNSRIHRTNLNQSNSSNLNNQNIQIFEPINDVPKKRKYTRRTEKKKPIKSIEDYDPDYEISSQHNSRRSKALVISNSSLKDTENRSLDKIQNLSNQENTTNDVLTSLDLVERIEQSIDADDWQEQQVFQEAEDILFSDFKF